MSIGLDGEPMFIMRDEEGKIRFKAVVRPDKHCAAMLADAAGKTRLVIAVKEDGKPAVHLRDGHGKTRIEASVLAKGGAQLLMTDPTENTRACLVIGDDGTPVVQLADPKGKVIWQAPGATGGAKPGHKPRVPLPKPQRIQPFEQHVAETD